MVERWSHPGNCYGFCLVYMWHWQLSAAAITWCAFAVKRFSQYSKCSCAPSEGLALQWAGTLFYVSICTSCPVSINNCCRPTCDMPTGAGRVAASIHVLNPWTVAASQHGFTSSLEASLLSACILCAARGQLLAASLNAAAAVYVSPHMAVLLVSWLYCGDAMLQPECSMHMSECVAAVQIPLAILFASGPESLASPSSSARSVRNQAPTPPVTCIQPQVGAPSVHQGPPCKQAAGNAAASFLGCSLLLYAALWLLSDLALRSYPDYACGSWMQHLGLAQCCADNSRAGCGLNSEHAHWFLATSGYSIMVLPCLIACSCTKYAPVHCCGSRIHAP